MALAINEFYDINKFPKEPGITYCSVSMPLLATTQTPEEWYKIDLYVIPKILVSNVGCVVGYSDGLYMYSPDEAMNLKVKFQKLIGEHKNGWLNLIKKNLMIVPRSFSFTTWQQLILECENFSFHLEQFRKIYDNDSYFQKLVKRDIESVGKEVNKYTIGYILEEILLDYMVVRGRVRLQNDYTQDKEEWILNIYHGKPHRSYVYLCQKNLMGIDNPKNLYQNSWYDVTAKKLYEFDRLDIETFDFSKNSQILVSAK